MNRFYLLVILLSYLEFLKYFESLRFVFCFVLFLKKFHHKHFHQNGTLVHKTCNQLFRRFNWVLHLWQLFNLINFSKLVPLMHMYTMKFDWHNRSFTCISAIIIVIYKVPVNFCAFYTNFFASWKTSVLFMVLSKKKNAWRGYNLYTKPAKQHRSTAMYLECYPEGWL